MHELNLLPDDFIEKVKWRKSVLIWIETVACGFVMIILIYNLSVQKMSSVKQEISQLYQEQSAVQPLIESIERLEQKRKQLHFMEQLYHDVKEDQSVRQIPQILAKVIPSGVRVTSLRVNGANSFSLGGKARSNADIAAFMSKLSQFERFRGTELLYASREQDGKAVYTRFEIKKGEAGVIKK